MTIKVNYCDKMTLYENPAFCDHAHKQTVFYKKTDASFEKHPFSQHLKISLTLQKLLYFFYR